MCGLENYVIVKQKIPRALAWGVFFGVGLGFNKTYVLKDVLL